MPFAKQVKSDGDYERFFADMRQYLATQQDAIEQACSHVRRMTCCLLCYEESVDTCHRKIVAQMIQERLATN